MRERHPLSWLPPFVVGAAGAMAGMVAVGLLLYSGDGFLRALTVVLATLLGALALGVWSAPPPGLDQPVEALRRRWLTVLVVFSGAAVAAAGWSLLGGLASGPVARGAGLALLAAAPLWAVGTLLGTMSAVQTDLALRGPGAAAAAGAAAGAVFTGVFFVRIVAPFAMHVFFLIALSGGALVHGLVLDHDLEPPASKERDDDRGDGGSVVAERREAP